MSRGIRLVVAGTPAPQGSKRAFTGKDGKARVIESSHERVKSWRQAVIDEARSELDMAGWEPYTGPLTLEVQFYMRRPASHYGTGKNRDRLKPSAPRRPAGTPDLSKLVRSTEDALTDAGIWKDDALVVAIHAVKLYADDIDHPGAIISVIELARASAREDDNLEDL